MRSTRLTAAFAAASTLLVLAPAGALAAHRHSLRGARAGCQISLFAEPHQVTTGETAQVFGNLRCGGAPVEGQTVTVFEHSVGIAGFKMVGSPTSGTGGAYTFTSSPIVDDSTFYVSALGARSRIRIVRVAPQVTLLGPAEGSQLKTGIRSAVSFAGIVSPADAGARVFLEREQATGFEEWGAIQETTVRPNGSYAMTHIFRVPGDANLRVIISPHGKFDLRGISNTLSYEISQNQNPHLTIFSSSDPVSFGLPVTISGVLAGGANQKVTLFGRVFPASAGFAKVQETTTNGSGEYKFVIPAAAQSTGYRVSANTSAVNSAVLFQGVKYSLTAGVSANTVQAGQSLTFSGAVTPARAGKPVYLERQNLIGGGFHIVDLTTVSSTGGYSITHFMFGPGKQVYRVHVPGDPDNQAVSSPTFPIEVTPAPVGSLRPVSQGTLPH
jgi:hypothetical protein